MAVILKRPAGDLQIKGGKITLIGGTEYLRIKLLARHRFFLGEWFRDRRLGFPWRELVFKKSPDLEIIRSAYRQMILKTPGVVSLENLSLSPDYENRAIGVEFTVIGTEGKLIVNRGSDEFIIR